MTLLEIFLRDGLLEGEPNILAEYIMNSTSVKPHEVKMFVKREMQGMYTYTFEAPTGVIQWQMMDRPDSEVREGASKWVASPGGEPLGEAENQNKDECLLELVARTMTALDKGMTPDHDQAILEKGSKMNLLRYLTRHMDNYQKLCKVFK